MEIGADFSHDEGKDDLLALRAALDNYHRADEPWVEKPFEATLLTARKIILSDETMGAIADLEIRLARYDTLIGCSPYRSTVVQLMSRFEGVCAAVANGFKPDWRTCCYLDYYLAHGAVPAVGLSAALAKATGADSQTVQSSLCAHQIEAIVTRLLEEEQSSTRLSAERIIALNDALCRTINPTWELGMRKWDPPCRAPGPRRRLQAAGGLVAQVLPRRSRRLYRHLEARPHHQIGAHLLSARFGAHVPPSLRSAGAHYLFPPLEAHRRRHARHTAHIGHTRHPPPKTPRKAKAVPPPGRNGRYAHSRRLDLPRCALNAKRRRAGTRLSRRGGASNCRMAGMPEILVGAQHGNNPRDPSPHLRQTCVLCFILGQRRPQRLLDGEPDGAEP